MNRLALRFFCYLAFALQVLSVSGIARGVTKCTHPDGQLRLETAAEFAACHAKQQVEDVAIIDRSCVDSPLVPTQITQQLANSKTASLDVSQFPVALPAFLRELTSTLFLKPSVARRTNGSLTVPDGERASLKTVILVI